MAEDDQLDQINEETDEEGQPELEGKELTSSSAPAESKRTPVRHNKVEPNKKPCNLRIDELSTPPRRTFLALWNDHSYHFPREKNDRLKLLLQELYAMTPEETARYFAELRAEAKAAEHRRKVKEKLRHFLKQKEKRKQRDRAYKLFRRLLKCSLKYAATNPVPALVSLRLRYLSDVILEQLCELREVKKPNRDGPLDKTDSFLIQIADWMAIGMERLYYVAQLAINEITAKEGGDSKNNCYCVDDSIHSVKKADVIAASPKKAR